MAATLKIRDRATRPAVREIADQAFSRTAGAPLIAGNSVELWKKLFHYYSFKREEFLTIIIAAQTSKLLSA